MVFLIVLLSFLDDDFLVNVELFGRNGLWYLGVLGAILAVIRALIPEDEIFTPEETMQEVFKHTSYKPSSWEGRCHTYQVWRAHTRCYCHTICVLYTAAWLCCLTLLACSLSLSRS
jgi:autophagy-related protein 9